MLNKHLLDPLLEDSLIYQGTEKSNLLESSKNSVSFKEKPIRFGVIADLHHDLMHDGIDRMKSFLNRISMNPVDAIIQLGDFAYPNAKNADIINLFNQAHEHSLHVIGNHDTDSAHTKQMCLNFWGMPSPYYVQQIGEFTFLVLDGNELGSPTYQGGYPSYISSEQIDWLNEQLEIIEEPIIIISHQPLAGNFAIDNAAEVQSTLERSSDKIILAINGHSHIDEVLNINGISYIHVNSASYYWVGDPYKHDSYPQKIHQNFPWISYTCPYRDSLFAIFTIDLNSRSIEIEGRHSQWVGKSPFDLNYQTTPDLKHNHQITPMIRNRFL